MSEQNSQEVVLIGRKEFGSYMKSIELLLRKRNQKRIVLRARGMNIKRAIDLSEAAKRKPIQGIPIKIGEIKTYTSKFLEEKSNKEISVSCIDIELLVN